ncbi:MAG: copper chaperone PCu(A)C [Candidatus Accumulibacter meliphilus]|uniref:copper chaperone PCu(A)C n=1 Tax=Candidatus Accumulibacter meliphilus TaxID=2211374 RepID=UPI002FC285F4
MTISNSGSSDRKLLQAESPVARKAELHTHLNDQGMMRMRQVADIEIKAGAQTELKPGGYHVMLLDLQQPLKEGDSVTLTLRFDDGSTKEIDAAVKKPQTVMKAPTPATARRDEALSKKHLLRPLESTRSHAAAIAERRKSGTSCASKQASAKPKHPSAVP